MASVEEASALELILHDDVFPLVREHIDPEVFRDRGFQALFRAIKNRDIVNGRIPPANVMIPRINAMMPELDQNSLQAIKAVLDAARALKKVEVGQAIGAISEFLDKRYKLAMARLVYENRFKEADRYLPLLSRRLNAADAPVNPSLPEELIRIRNMDFPGGKQEPMPSSSRLICDALTHKGYKVGDLVMVVAPPKVGKSTFMAQEGATFIRNGYRVLHIAIGDMSRFDVTAKYLSNMTGKHLSEVMDRPVEALKVGRCQEVMARLRLESFPAMSVNVDKLASYVRTQRIDFEFDGLIIDYDANISTKGESIYEAGGVLYSTLKGIAEESKCVLFVGSQPKQPCWTHEPLKGDSAAESSRKQQAVDVMITIAQNQRCADVGTLYLPLVRRGVSKSASRIRFQYGRSRIAEITRHEYEESVNSGGSISVDAEEWRATER